METFDVIVLGTGAAALTAAIRASAAGARVGLFEKADTVGGTSAWSGGMVWIPMNPHMAELGISDSREEVLTYFGSLSNGLIDMDLAAALIDAGPEAVTWLEQNTPVQFQIIKDFPDYHPEHPGAKPGGGRSLECPLFPFVSLGEWQHRVTVGPQLSGNIMMSETSLGRGAPQGVDPAELERRKIRDERGAGQGLIGPLLKGCLDRGIEPRTGMRAVELLRDGRRISGVRFETASGSVEVGATRGVIIATGGFEWDPELVRAFIRGPLVRSASVPTNTGDGLKMAMRVGAALGNMREGWWVAIIDVPVGGRMAAWQVNGERTRPHCIMVNSLGRRFTNEAANYNALGAAFHVIDVSGYSYVNHPAWMIFDRHYLTRYGLAGYRGEGATPDWITEAPSVAELAAAMGVPAAALEETVARWNGFSAGGRDDDFGRGNSVHDRWWGDPAFGPGPAATLGPLDSAPFYAVQVYSGVLGTKGGPRTDENGQVQDVDGQPIPGLYAAGNAMASAMGMTYGGAGGTLGPAVVFGYLAGRARGIGGPVVTGAVVTGAFGFGGKVALVTGAAGGMGRATAQAFAAAGAQVVAADIAADGGEETVDSIKRDGGSAVFVRTDVSSAREVEAAVAAAVANFGGLDCACNAAAIETETTLLADCDEATFDRLVAVNLKSIFLCLKYEIRAMLERGGGAIVNIASTNSFRPLPKQSVYTATKHGVVGMTKTAAIEYAGSGIRINAVAPGAIDTPMLRGAMAARGSVEEDVLARLSLIGRFGQPEEIANAVLWLCSDQASYTMGHVLSVDGGYLAR